MVLFENEASQAGPVQDPWPPMAPREKSAGCLVPREKSAGCASEKVCGLCFRESLRDVAGRRDIPRLRAGLVGSGLCPKPNLEMAQ